MFIQNFQRDACQNSCQYKQIVPLTQNQITDIEVELEDELNTLINQNLGESASGNHTPEIKVDGVQSVTHVVLKEAKRSTGVTLDPLGSIPGYEMFLDSSKNITKTINDTFDSIKQCEKIVPTCIETDVSISDSFDTEDTVTFIEPQNFQMDSMNPVDPVHLAVPIDVDIEENSSDGKICHQSRISPDISIYTNWRSHRPNRLETFDSNLGSYSKFSARLREEALKEAEEKVRIVNRKQQELNTKKLLAELAQVAELRSFKRRNTMAKKLQVHFKELLARKRSNLQIATINKMVCKFSVKHSFKRWMAFIGNVIFSMSMKYSVGLFSYSYNQSQIRPLGNCIIKYSHFRTNLIENKYQINKEITCATKCYQFIVQPPNIKPNPMFDVSFSTTYILGKIGLRKPVSCNIFKFHGYYINHGILNHIIGFFFDVPVLTKSIELGTEIQNKLFFPSNSIRHEFNLDHSLPSFRACAIKAWKIKEFLHHHQLKRGTSLLLWIYQFLSRACIKKNISTPIIPKHFSLEDVYSNRKTTTLYSSPLSWKVVEETTSTSCTNFNIEIILPKRSNEITKTYFQFLYAYNFATSKDYSCTIQRIFRGFQVRSRLKTELNPKLPNKNLEKPKFTSEFNAKAKNFIPLPNKAEDKLRSIVLVQRVYRGFYIRSLLKKRYPFNFQIPTLSKSVDIGLFDQQTVTKKEGPRLDPSILIQKIYRGFRARRRVKNIVSQNFSYMDDDLENILSDDADYLLNSILDIDISLELLSEPNILAGRNEFMGDIPKSPYEQENEIQKSQENSFLYERSVGQEVSKDIPVNDVKSVENNSSTNQWSQFPKRTEKIMSEWNLNDDRVAKVLLKRQRKIKNMKKKNERKKYTRCSTQRLSTCKKRC